jgi:hypothetical protein
MAVCYRGRRDRAASARSARSALSTGREAKVGIRVAFAMREMPEKINV